MHNTIAQITQALYRHIEAPHGGNMGLSNYVICKFALRYTSHTISIMGNIANNYCYYDNHANGVQICAK